MYMTKNITRDYHDQLYHNKKELFALLLGDQKSARAHLGHFLDRERLMNKSAANRRWWGVKKRKANLVIKK